MKHSQIGELATGTLLKVALDGKPCAGQVGQFKKLSSKGNAALMIAGRIVWIKPERLSKNG